MIHQPIDVSTRISPELSDIIERLSNDMDTDEPLTLGRVRDIVADMLPAAFNEAEAMHRFDMDESLLDELEALIEEYGEHASAIEFVQHEASEALSRVIETVAGDDSFADVPLTLAAVREAIESGVASQLTGEGALEEDEAATLLEELDGLIARYGELSLAENFIRFE
ncbi:MAG: hypothetical protein KGI47_08010 [Betaproteobacteria bacterium]|nr:hypothetical protein [Betaproteobacteria bacterium]MDE2622677.1 hypothetical protein [Betaproteobacteria bacterium]